MRVRITIFAALNLDLPDWYELFQKKHLVDALLDRLQHHCIIIRIDGPSLRTPEPQPPDAPVPSRAPRERATPNDVFERATATTEPGVRNRGAKS